MNYWKHLLLLVCSTGLLLLPAESKAQFYNGINTTFGKNRVQYKEFLWQYYRFESYDTYFYEGGKELAAYVSKVAPAHLKDIQNKLDFVIDEHIEFIVYNTHSDFKQSNLGLAGIGGDVVVGGSAQIVGTKVFLYFDGDHAAFERSLREGIARMIIQNMLYGGDWKEVVKNSALLNLPNWYVEGLVTYLVDEWTPEIRDRVADGIRHDHYAHFNRLSNREAVYAGFSIWRYIADTYGPSVIPNILYMTRLNRHVENGFLYVIGVDIDQLLQEHRIYYSNYFALRAEGREDPPLENISVRTKKERFYNQFKLSPDGQKAAFVSNELGQYRLHLIDVHKYRKKEAGRREKYEAKKAKHAEGQKEKARRNPSYIVQAYRPYKAHRVRGKRIYKAGHKIERKVDRSYPVLEWHPSGTDLAFFTEKKGKLWLSTYSLNSKKTNTREIFGLDKVTAFDYASTGTQMVFSGVAKGQTDLYLYYMLGNRQEKLTNDLYDDLEPRFNPKGNRVIFSSNRSLDTLDLDYDHSQALRDIFVMDLDNRKVLERISNSPNRDERAPFAYDGQNYTFLADKDLIYDRYLARYDSVISHIDTTIHYRYYTDLSRLSKMESNPIEYHLNADKSYYSFLNFMDGDYRFNIGKTKNDQQFELSDTSPLPEDNDTESTVLAPGIYQDMEVHSEETLKPHPLGFPDYRFLNEGQQNDNNPENEIEDDSPEEEDNSPVIIEDIETIIALQQGTEKLEDTQLPSPRLYKLNFAVDRADVDIANSYNMEFYQEYLPGGVGISPGFSPAMEWRLTDLFEDKRITGSVGILGSIDDLAYGLRYDNYTKRLDKSLLFQRQSRSLRAQGLNGGPGIIIKSHSHVLRYLTSYPINEVFSVRTDLTGTYQRDVVRVQDDLGRRIPNFHLYLAGAKSQLVFDNTLSKGLNLFNGTRAKAWVEYYRELDFDNKEFPSIGTFGLDLRHYQKIHRDLIAAFRFAGHTSFGEQRVVSFLGAVDNWMLPSPSADTRVEVDPDQNYRYQALISPMRGFLRNIRNGTSAAVANVELRFPVVKYFSNKPVQSDFLGNLQVIGFGDIGTAWTGSGPYDDSNTFNIQEEPISPIPNNNSVLFILKNHEDPVVSGYGFGLRSRILGYFVRADWAWGLIDGAVQPREFYFSLNLDF